LVLALLLKQKLKYDDLVIDSGLKNRLKAATELEHFSVKCTSD